MTTLIYSVCWYQPFSELLSPGVLLRIYCQSTPNIKYELFVSDTQSILCSYSPKCVPIQQRLFFYLFIVQYDRLSRKIGHVTFAYRCFPFVTLSSYSRTRSSVKEIAVVYLCLQVSCNRFSFAEHREKSGPPFGKATNASTSNQQPEFFFYWKCICGKKAQYEIFLHETLVC